MDHGSVRWRAGGRFGFAAVRSAGAASSTSHLYRGAHPAQGPRDSQSIEITGEKAVSGRNQGVGMADASKLFMVIQHRIHAFR